MDYFYGIINPHFREAYLAVQESLTEYMQEYEDKKIGEWKVKTEEEIKEKIEDLKKLRDAHDFRSVSYYRCSAGVHFLEWVLEE